MTPEEKQAHDALVVELKSVIAESSKENKDLIVELKSKVKELEEKKADITAEEFKSVKDECIRIASELKAAKEVALEKKENINVGLKSAILIALEAKKADFDAIVSAGGKQTATLSVEVKSAIDMSVTNTIEAGTTKYSVTSNTGIISTIRKRTEAYFANVSVGTMSGDEALWIEELDEQGVPIFLAEGAASTQLSVRYEERTKSVKEIAVYGKVTLKLLADLPQLASYIANNIMKKMDLKVEDQLLYGNDTGDNLKGIDGYATAFSAGALATSIERANEWDVLNAIATQVELAYGIPNAVFIHPSTVQAMKAVKSSTGEPLWKYYQDNDGNLVVGGMRLISTPAITAGSFIGGDLSAVNVLNRETIGIQIGLDGSDFINRKKTMLASRRLVQFVSANDTPVLVKGDFVTAKAALLLV